MDVGALRSQFSELCTVEEKKNVLVKNAFRMIEMHEERIKDLELELESEKSSRRTFQVENTKAKAEVRRLNDINNRYPFIVVLVDGDGAKFLDTLLQSPDGAAEASRRLTKAVRTFLQDSPYSSEDVPILVRIYANLKDLATALQKNKVIPFEKDLHRFAEQFTNSRAEFEFINVGPGKENADSKMTRMLNHYYRNFQCKKVFFAACHDQGYVHQLRDFIGDSVSEKRIILVETTPAKALFTTLGFEITRFNDVFRCEHLPSEQEPGRLGFQRPSVTTADERNGTSSLFRDSGADSNGEFSQATTTHSPALATPLIHGSGMDSDIDVSGNGGISVRYPSTYATIGGSNHHQNLTIKRRETKETKKIEYNRYKQRLDPPIRPPSDAAANDSYYKKLHQIAPRGFCNDHYLLGRCDRFRCKMEHDEKLNAKEIIIQKYKARQGQCLDAPGCTDYDCYFSHHCPFGKKCHHSPCKFSLHISENDHKVVERWVEGESGPEILETYNSIPGKVLNGINYSLANPPNYPL
ncbi:Uncharacterized protein PECH_004814 [Penicillium ucsense]|uniref:C3H1-type domain-containing protein n=1 Tax=Penicillium ucsense TaxID=2839758 RepID=A0A8J8W6S8_9EURO|nr:Uncharacterized protein PECM_007550 [Penicillium ucsense]KAF7739329.1 Uncharacterized protein PECH_004814 [Penicillium ucsense]